MTITTRFAPSPTGLLHFGNARTALISYLFARQNEGKFILRIDDTDQERSKPEYIDEIRNALFWLGIDYQQTFNQSSRIPVYKKYVQQLIAMGKLYPCYETKEELELQRKIQLASKKPPIYDRNMLTLTPRQQQEFESTGRKPHYRFKLDHDTISWVDLIKGKINFDASKISDPILIKEDGSFLYSLCSVIDDIDYKVSHVIRGEDHLANTAIHVQIFKCCQASIPTFAHMSLIKILGGDAFSKRSGSLSLKDMREQGLHPLAIANYLFSLGQTETKELFTSIGDMAAAFNFANYSTSAVNFDSLKLEHLNRQILQSLSVAEVREYLLDFMDEQKITSTLWELAKNNISYLTEVESFYQILHGTIDLTPEVKQQINRAVIKIAIDSLPDQLISEEMVKQWFADLKKATKYLNISSKDLFISIRVAISGQLHGPLLVDLILAMDFPILKQRLHAAIV